MAVTKQPTQAKQPEDPTKLDPTETNDRGHVCDSDPHGGDCGCADVPAFRRLRYFYGQALGAADLRREQAYSLDKARLRNRLLHGWGIVCGLDVEVITTTECDPPVVEEPKPTGDDQAAKDKAAAAKDQAAKDQADHEKKLAEQLAADQAKATAALATSAAPGQVREPAVNVSSGRARGVSTLSVCSGAAIDCDGNEIVVRQPSTFAVNDRLSKAQLRELKATPATIYITLCYHEELVQPTRPLISASCDPIGACEYAGVLECYRICVTTERPDPGPRCEPCCGACGSKCLELVAITNYDPSQPITSDQLDFSGRRSLAVQQLTTITGINWFHGATYERDAATAFLDGGLEVVFSHPVDAASLQPGIVELLVAEGGDGRAGNLYSVSGEFVGVPASGLVNSFVYRSNSGERLQYGDRVNITVRGDFIVDECCRAVDANHLGGAVPTLASTTVKPVAKPVRPVCPPRPSGDGVEGGEFVSWVFVQERGED